MKIEENDKIKVIEPYTEGQGFFTKIKWKMWSTKGPPNWRE